MAASEQKENKIGNVDVNDADEQTTQDLTEFVQSLLHKMVCLVGCIVSEAWQ